MTWTVSGQLALRRVVGERVLVVHLQVDELILFALETTKSTEDDESDQAIEHVLGAHAHKLIGRMPDLQTAISVAEGFVEEWGSGTPLALCQCGTATQER
jgi:hypothetical protein